MNLVAIESTATLGLKASAKAREAIVSGKIFSLLGRIKPLGKVRPKEVEALIHEELPGIKVAVRGLSMEGEYAGCISYNNSKIEKYTMELPFKKGVLDLKDKDKQGTLLHEFGHLALFSISPKVLARRALGRLIDAKYSTERGMNYSDFYQNILYNNELENGFRSSIARLFGRTPKAIKAFQRNPVAATQQRKETIKTQLMKLFKDPQISSNEKIDALQFFRNGIISENKSFNTGLLLKETAEGKKSVQQNLQNNYFFDEKLNVLDQMLKEEIATHRQIHAQKLKVT